jgi:hydrogenase nickel incorporation protein HypA/HybF
VSVHELSICDAIARTVADHAAGRPVRSVTVRIGHLRQVVPETLMFSWEMVTRTTVLDGARLRVEHVPAVVACAACGAVTTLDAPILACGTCCTRTVALRSGDEMLVTSIEVGRADAVAQAAS